MPVQDKVRDLHAGQQVKDAVFLLAEKQVRMARNGRPYLSARLRDTTGEMEARYWDVPPGLADRLQAGQGVRVTGDVTEYQGRLQIKLDAILPQPIDVRQFVPAADQPREEMQEQLRQRIASVEDSWLRRLLEQVLLSPSFLDQFSEAPAAREFHHAYLGGLMQHTLGVADLADAAAALYPVVPRDLLLAVALLHDVGKVEGYEWRSELRRSDEGRLLEHIYLGTRRVEQAIDALPGFPQELRRRVLHALLAHHGEEAYGSPIRPQTLEAVVLHQIDMLDARIRGFLDHVERNAGETVWTEWSTMFGAQLYRGQPEAAPGTVGEQPQLWDDLAEEGLGNLPF